MNKRERLIRNKAATVANQDSYQIREADIDHLETLREACGLNMGEISNLLGKPNNWYSNHQRAGGTHEFSRPDYFRIRDLLEVEYLRDRVGFSENEVSRGVNNSSGWYEKHLKDGFKIDEYNKVLVFLVTAAVIQYKNDVLNEETLNEFVNHGIVGEDLIQDLKSSVDIDYGH
ncbi:hypothetical protein OB914_13670 [Halobacteria archaeon HArc-curdl7]|uniref:Uncharacterized protein n=1 Tax=Halapricum hydrolyticum TaxID=2979991 RepID=A0AAE3ID09_9EURY|nr:hypothetical protein [Halapricum hydrolyticum]